MDRPAKVSNGAKSEANFSTLPKIKNQVQVQTNGIANVPTEEDDEDEDFYKNDDSLDKPGRKWNQPVQFSSVKKLRPVYINAEDYNSRKRNASLNDIRVSSLDRNEITNTHRSIKSILD